MYSTATFVGYVLSTDEPRFSTEQTCIEVKVACRTGEKKKEGEQYDPSHIISFLLWGRYAEVMEPILTPGTLVAVTGQLATPYIRENPEGGYRYTLRFVDNRVDTVKVLSRATEKQNSDKRSKSNKQTPTALTREAFGDFDDDFDEDDDF